VVQSQQALKYRAQSSCLFPIINDTSVLKHFCFK